MTLRKDEGLGSKVIIVIGVIASCIAIFAFITGKQSIPEILSTPNFTPIDQDPSQIAYLPTANVLASENTSQPVESPIPLTKGLTSTPQVIEFENTAVSIIIKDSSSINQKGEVHFQFLAGGTRLQNISLLFMPAKKDITGNWTSGYEAGTVYEDAGTIYKSDTSGDVNVSLQPGIYAAWNPDSRSVWNQLMGNWGIQGFGSDGSPAEMIVFPVIAGKTTEIIVSLARLEIGLVSTQGEALKQARVDLYCQGTDIAGQKISSERCQWSAWTDITGIATFHLGPGTYMISVYNWPKDDVYVYDISLKAGQVRRRVLTIPR